MKAWRSRFQGLVMAIRATKTIITDFLLIFQINKKGMQS